MWSVVEHIGRVGAVVAGAGLTCVAVALAAATLARLGCATPLKRFSLLVLEVLYVPLGMLLAALPGKPSLDALMVALRNRANRARFARARSRVLLAPACLRHVECAAPTGRRGLECARCGRCKLESVSEGAARLGYTVFVLAGSAAAPRLVAEERPDAVLLVACPHECNKVMMALGRLPTYAVPLERDGCVNTDVSLRRVAQALRMGLERAHACEERGRMGGCESAGQSPTQPSISSASR